ncbi:iron-containing alcohol dehydrogenase [Phormidium tenue]|uniref:Alcohol dehydrogenase n=1 Tax=Phormidium tenue NIES-30 TaxID=549789 RepID=A0A1U7J0S5_9CYAN|nr:iron-containing alcohol dehydrogenase [Phormidium tenue]MBD2234256.1 iron-containing alcohol dehydrogenase [Phormidium tenue FACHB-1052]OKH45191.1 alcohol dehydrogenase [Phormidium tenue NIES-30]
MSSIHTYNFPTHIRFGPGARAKLTAELTALGIQRVLIVTDRDVAQLPWFPELQASLAAFGAVTFSGVWGNPVVSQVNAGIDAWKASGADGIVAVGGGAPMDVAKAIALMANHPGHLFDYEDGHSTRPIDQPIPPIVALPTTAGTGSEVGRSAVISDDDTHAKKIVFDPQLLPQVVLADPELLLGLPAKITAATGMDALTHLVEAFLAKGFNPLCDGIALEGIHLVAENLQACVDFARRSQAGEAFGEAAAAHLAARGGMLNASMMGAIAFQKGLGVTHSCAHALSTVYDTHHGLANGVMLPAAMRFNLSAAPERFLRMARVVKPGATDGQEFIDWIVGLSESIGIPASLGALGVTPDGLGPLVAVAMKDGCHPLNPKPVIEKDFYAIYQDAF